MEPAGFEPASASDVPADGVAGEPVVSTSASGARSCATPMWSGSAVMKGFGDGAARHRSHVSCWHLDLA